MFEYLVEYEYTEGRFYRDKGSSKSRVVPKTDRLTYETAKFEASSDNQIKVIISKYLQKRGIKTPYIVNIRTISKTEI